jgi:hypothetical protein
VIKNILMLSEQTHFNKERTKKVHAYSVTKSEFISEIKMKDMRGIHYVSY